MAGKPTCDTCRHWWGHPEDHDGEGTCRHSAPVISMDSDPRYGHWPVTLDTDGCSQHTPLSTYQDTPDTPGVH